VCRASSGKTTADGQAAAAAAAAAITITVASWNVKHFTCVQGTVAHLEKLENLARDIVRSGADIVVLQEVRSGAN
jgi:endonuclease/exonuclease/phosphatase family metal-dependent hydrolase